MPTTYNDPIMLDSTGQDIVTKLDNIATLMGDGVIDDTSTATNKTWSASKLNTNFSNIKDGTSIDSFGDVETALAGKQNTLTFDQTPRDNSQNPVKSDGLYDSFVGAYKTVKASLGFGVRNLLRNENSEDVRTVNSVTFTKMSDGTVKLNGTASGAIVYGLMRVTGAQLKAYGEKLWLSGGIDTNTFLALIKEDWSYSTEDKGNGKEIDPSTLTDVDEYIFVIEVANGTALSNVIISPVLTLASVLDKSFESGHKTVAEMVDDIYKINGKLGAKNLLYNAKETRSGENNGITYTLHDDNTVTANGTATGNDAQFLFADRNDMNFELDAGTYIVSGCPSGGNVDTGYRIQIARNTVYGNPSAGFTSVAKDDGNGAMFTLAEKAQLSVSLLIPVGVSVSNIVFKPMICFASDTDSTYRPHAETNLELTKNKVDWDGYAQTGAVNLNVYPYNYSGTVDFQDVDVTFNADGTMILNGTASANDNIIFHSRAGYSSLPDKHPIILTAGTYKVSRSTTGYIVRVVRTVNSQAEELMRLSGDAKEGTFTIAETSQIGLIVDIYQDVVFDNKLVDIMLSVSSYNGGFVPYAMTNRELTEKFAVIKHEIRPITKASGVDCTFDNDIKYAYAQGNVVNFKLRITVNTATDTTDHQIASLDFVPVLSYPHVSIRNRTSPYAEAYVGYINPASEIGISGITLQTGTYDITGVYICKDPTFL